MVLSHEEGSSSALSSPSYGTDVSPWVSAKTAAHPRDQGAQAPVLYVLLTGFTMLGIKVNRVCLKGQPTVFLPSTLESPWTGSSLQVLEAYGMTQGIALNICNLCSPCWGARGHQGPYAC